jgi:Peptidase C13 family
MKRSAIVYAFTGFVLLGVGSADRGRAEALNDTRTEAKGYIVALGLSDDLHVFHSEATRAAAILAKYYGRGAAPLVFTNSRTSRAATVESLRDALARSSSRMDRENDVLFVFLTSHGSQQGVQIKAGKRRSVLQPAELGALLRATNVRNKVLIISACYSGVFTPLADARTLVITAADATHPSFGCEETATWTYFGRAFFSQAMPKTNNLRDTFVLARSLVLARERKRGYQPSNPQMRGGEDFVTRLRAAR